MNNNLMEKSKDNFLVVRDLLEKSRNEIAKALPKSITPERVARIALTTLRKNPSLLECDPNSFLGAVMQASQLGLEIDDNLGYGYLTPNFNKKTGKKEVQFRIGYRGLIELARRSGKLKNITAKLVYENEPFEIEYGLMENLKHKPLPPSKRGENIVGAYAVATMNDGAKAFEFLWEEEIEKIKKSSPSGTRSDSAWFNFEEEMMKKTVIRKIMKYLSLSPETTKAAVIDEYGEAGINTKDVFIGQEENKTLGMTEPKAITDNSKKISELSAYRTQTQENTSETETKTEGPAGAKAETETAGSFAGDRDDDSGYYDDIPWDDVLEMSAMQTNQTNQTEETREPIQNPAAKKENVKENIEYISEKQITFVGNLCKRKGIGEDQMPELTETVFGEPIDIAELTKKQATVLIDYLKEIA